MPVWTTELLVSIIGGVSVILGPLMLWKLQQGSNEAKRFREENSLQHGETLKLVQDIQMATREIASDVRETKQDIRELQFDLEVHKRINH